MAKHASCHVGASYLRPAVMLNTWRTCVAAMVYLARHYKVKFDTVVFRGNSGCLIGPAVASQLGKEFLLVRKPDEKSHSGCGAEGNVAIQRFIIIDDFVSSGTTVEAILAGIDILASQYPEKAKNPKCVGIFCYASWSTLLAFVRQDRPYDDKDSRIPFYSVHVSNNGDINHVRNRDVSGGSESYSIFCADNGLVMGSYRSVVKWFAQPVIQAML